MANVDLKTNFKNGDKLYDYELNNNFKAIKAALEAMNKIVWQNDDNASLVMFAGTTEQITNRELIEGQLLYNTQTGETYIDAKVDENIKRISTGGGTSIQIGGTEPTNPATKLWIVDDLINNIGTEVVNTLSGNETNKAPSVYIINKITKKNMMMINLDNVQTVTTDTETKVLFNKINFQLGDKLTFESNGIKIGAGVSKVRIDLTLWLEGRSPDTYGAFYIVNSRAGNLTYNLKAYDGKIVWDTANSYIYANVQEGDIIYANVRFSVAGNTNAIAGNYTNACLLSVEVVE